VSLILYWFRLIGRYSTEEAKRYKRTVIRDTDRDVVQGKGKEKEKMYIYPPGQEEPSPMYEGLRTNLPHVRCSFCIWSECQQADL
jgi:hypothetical protein